MKQLRLSTATLTICGDVDKILRQSFGKQLYNPKPQDQVRLLKLRMWSERHKISLTYILESLVPHFEKLASKHSRTSRIKISKGLGTTVTVLTGQAAEEFLQDKISKDFPDDEHLVSWKEDKKAECLVLLDEEELVGKPRKVLSYKSVSAFTDAYRKRMEHARVDTSKQEVKLGKQPWRGNPWR